MSKTILRDTIPFQYKILKNESNSNETIIEGLLSIADAVNGNVRKYTRKLWERVVNDKQLQQAISEGQVMGELEHPDDGSTHLGRVTHIVDKLWMEGDKVYTRCRLLDNQLANRLKDIFAKGGRPGVSTRGKGTSYMEDGVECVNEDDYVFETYDFVYNPSVSSARPSVVNESQSKKPKSSENIKKEGAAQNMLTAIEKIENKVNDIRKLLKNKISNTDKQRYLSELREFRIEIDKLVSTDPSIKSVASEVQTLISEAQNRIKYKKTKSKNIKESKRTKREEIDSMDDLDSIDDEIPDDADEIASSDMEMQSEEEDDDMDLDSDDDMGDDFADDDEFSDEYTSDDDEYEEEDEFDAEDDPDMDDSDDLAMEAKTSKSKKESKKSTINYIASFKCSNQKCRKNLSMNLNSSIIESKKLVKKCDRCNTKMRLESVNRVKVIQPTRKCTKCETTMKFENKFHCYSCKNPTCKHKIPVFEAMSKNDVLKRYKALSKVANDLAEKSKDLFKSNKKLSERFDTSVKLIGDMLTKRDEELIEKRINDAVKETPELKKFTSILNECKSMHKLEKTISNILSDIVIENNVNNYPNDNALNNLDESFDLPLSFSETDGFDDLDGFDMHFDESYADSQKTNKKATRNDNQNTVLNKILNKKKWL